ncbi:MAG: HEAT repeat domain-containing protein [Deltaproteobacteria bacterium]|nr:HEAT repeat domain-containing protein [Deltaproteobacteria bacterium]
MKEIPGPDGATGYCPAEAGLLLALTGFDPDPNLPAVSVAVGCAKENDKESDRESGQVIVHVAVELTDMPENEPETSYEGFGLGPCGSCGRGWSLFSIIETGRVIHNAVSIAREAYKVASAPDDTIIAILSTPESVSRETLLTAVGLSGDRKLSGAVPLLIGLLDASNRNVVLRAVGALGRIGDPRPLKALGRLGLSPAPEVPFAALQAIEDIGGREAVRTLELVADQTTDPVIARDALDHLERLKGENSG